MRSMRRRHLTAALSEQLKHEAPLVRAHAAHALGKLGDAAKPAVAA